MKVGNNAPVTIEPANQGPAKPAPTQSPTTPASVSPFAQDSIEISPADQKPTQSPEKASDEKKPWYDKFIPKTNAAKIKTIAAAAGIATGVTTALLVSALAGPALPLVILAGFVAAGAGANIAVTAMAIMGYGQDSEPVSTLSEPKSGLRPGETEIEKTRPEELETIARGPQLLDPKIKQDLRRPEDLEPVTRKPTDAPEIPTLDREVARDSESLG